MGKLAPEIPVNHSLPLNEDAFVLQQHFSCERKFTIRFSKNNLSLFLKVERWVHDLQW
ncbi:hypothetical protein ACT8ZS_25940 [Paenibacillus sp. M.A.Huq-84]